MIEYIKRKLQEWLLDDYKFTMKGEDIFRMNERAKEKLR